MSLLPHQYRALTALLRTDQYAAMLPDEAFARITSDKNLGGLRSLVFVSEEKASRFGKKSSPKSKGLLVVVPADEAVQFKDGIPGFPNVVKRPDFDLAWTEAHGG